jgi:hypothetical protein
MGKKADDLITRHISGNLLMTATYLKPPTKKSPKGRIINKKKYINVYIFFIIFNIIYDKI